MTTIQLSGKPNLSTSYKNKEMHIIVVQKLSTIFGYGVFEDFFSKASYVMPHKATKKNVKVFETFLWVKCKLVISIRKEMVPVLYKIMTNLKKAFFFLPQVFEMQLA